MRFVKAAQGGFQQITTLNAASALTVPPGATFALIQAESQNVRWRSDGTNPTAGVGEILYVGDKPTLFSENLSALRFIEVTPSAKINVTYGY